MGRDVTGAVAHGMGKALRDLAVVPLMTSDMDKLVRRARILLGLFVVGLILSGLTAFPIRAEVDVLERVFGEGSPTQTWWPWLAAWISFVHRGVSETSAMYPFLFYGTDWLAFAHIVIAVAFIGPLRDPVRNVWVVEFGMIACVLVVPAALVCGPIRGIPFFWRLIDCSFGVVGIVPLYLAWKNIRRVVQIRGDGTVSPVRQDQAHSSVA